jgi:hypothetical protein
MRKTPSTRRVLWIVDHQTPMAPEVPILRSPSLLAWDARRLVRAGSDPAAAVAGLAADGVAPFCGGAGDPEGGESPFEGDPAALSEATILLRRS